MTFTGVGRGILGEGTRYLDPYDFLAPQALIETKYSLNQQTLMFFEPGDIVRMTVGGYSQAGDGSVSARFAGT